MAPSVDPLLTALLRRLAVWRGDTASFDALLLEVFGTQASGGAALIEGLIASLESGTLRLRILPGSVMVGLRGAYASEAPGGGELILLNEGWLASAAAEEIEAVLLEELGHAIDHRLNGERDTAGDEGERFSALVRGVTSAASTALENDQATIWLDGIALSVEASGAGPSLLSASTTADGRKVVLTYNETLSATTAAADAFRFTQDGSLVPVTAAVVNGSTVELSLAWPVTGGRSLSISYSDPSSGDDASAIQSLSGVDAASLANIAVVNQMADAIPPVFQYAATSTDGSKLILTFSKPLSASLPGSEAFSVVVAGAPAAITNVAKNGASLELSLASPVAAGQAVTISYSDGSDADVAAAIQDASGNDAPAFSGEGVRNTVGTHVYYISATGSDSTGDGSAANPFASLSKVHALTGSAALQAGDTVYFLEGTYRNNNFGDGNIWKDSLSDFVLLLDRSGAAGNPITYAAAPGAHVVLEFDGPGAIRFQNAQHVNVQGFEVKGQNGRISLEEALAHQFEYRIDTDGDGSYLDEVSWFRPTTALVPGTTVLGKKPDGTDYVMPANKTLSSLGAKTPGSFGANAIIIAGSSNHIQILNNTVHDAPGAGISSLTGADYVLIRGNDFYNNNWFTPSGTHAISFKSITSSDTFTGAKVIVDGNTFSDNYSRLISWAPLQNDAVDMVVDEGKTLHVQNSTTASGWTHGQVQFSNNLIVRSGNAAITVNNAERIVMANNTIIDSGYLNRLIELGLVDPNMHEGFQVAASGFRLGGTSLTVINNLISSSTGQTINGVLKPLNVVDATAAVTGSGTGASLFADNLYFNGTVFLRTTTGNVALDAGFIPVDTLEELGFVDPAKGNYLLLRTSPAVNQGQTTTTNAALVLPEDLTGLTRDGLIDLGAFEFVGDALPPAPGTLSVSGKDNDLDNSFSLVLSGQEAGSSVVLQRSEDAGTTWADTTADQTGLAPGSYTYRARVSDPAGNTSYSALVAVSVASPYAAPNTTPPAAPVITALADDVGSNTLATSGDVSDDATPTLTITAAPGSVVRVFDHGILLGMATETATAGTFTFTTPTLQVGGHSFTARASDANGNLSDASAPYSMSVGVTESILYGGVTYNMAFTVTNKANLTDGTYTLVATGQAAGDTVQYRQSPNGTSSWAGLGGGPSPFTKEDTEASGTYYYQARVDFDGGTGYDWTSPTLTVTVDTAAAVTSIDTTAPSKPTLVSSVPSSEGQVLTLTLAAEAGSTVVIFDGSTPLGMATEGDNGTFTFNTGALASGTHPLSWRAIDAAGNASDLSATLVHTVASNSNNYPPTGSVTITGTPSQGQTLTAANTLADADGIPISSTGAITYQWKADGSTISGATGNSYVPTQAEVGKAITVTATYTDNGGTTESVTSAATAAVANLNDSPTGSVTISGTATEGQTLTAANSLADPDGIPGSGSGAIAYQWNADGTPISGATGSTLILTQAQVGKAITVTASYTDNGGQQESVTSTPTDLVVSANGAPSNLALSTASVAENADAGTLVGTLSTTDPNNSDTFTYNLVSGEVAALNLPIAVPDAGTTQSEMIVSGRASSVPLSSIALDLDIAHTWRGDLVVTLQAPSGEIITISNRNAGSTGDREDLIISSVALNSAQFGGINTTVNPNGTWILRVNDAAADDVGTINSWALDFSDGADNGLFTIDGNTLKTAAVFDFEAKNSYKIRVRSTDAGGLFTEKSFTVSATDVNETPTDLLLSSASVAGDASVGTTVGSLSTTDPDNGDTFTYTLVGGAGSTDNAAFTLEGSAIKTATVFDVQTKNTYNIRVRSTDADGLFTEKALTIRVIDQVASEADIPFASDSDGDGLANTIDTDDDNDGVLDNNDAQPLNAASSSPLTTSVSVATSADAPLLGNSTSNANTNYGTAATAQTRNGFRGLLMKFSLPADGVLQSATLKLYTSTENDPLDVYLYADNSWTEGGVTFNNANWENSVFLGTTGSPSGGIYSYTLPQNAALAPGQTVSLYVEDPDDPSGNVEALFTKETAGKAPYLMIEKSEPSPLNISFSDQEVYRNGGSFTVNVSMRSAPSGVVYAPLAVSDPSIASIVGASVLTFTPDNWADPQTVEITPGGVGAFTLVARPLHSADANFNGINPEDVLGFKVTAIDLAAGTAVTATTGQILSQDLEPTSAVGAGSFRWQLLSGPKGLNVVENSGRLTFRPTSDQAGLNTTAILQATDQFGNTANFEIPITVSAGVNADPVGIYVVPGIGSDSTGNGTAANPYGSIAYALDRAAETNQSTVFIRGGEYSFGSNKQTISTAANSEIVVKPLPGEHVKLNFSGFTGFDITSTARNITFEGLEIDGGSDSADFWDIVSVGFWTPDQISRGGGIAFNVDGQFITLRDNYIHDAYQKAVEIKDGRYVEVDGNIIRNIATTSLSGGHGIMRQQKGAEFFDNDLPGELRWDITGNLIFNVEQRIYSWVPSKGFIEMVLDEGKPILIDDPKDTNGSQEQMAARISNNVVAYGAIDGIRLKSTPNLEVSNNSVFSQAPLADGVSDRDGDTSTPKFTNFEFTNNAVQVSTDRFAVEIDDAVADAGTGAVVSGNVVAGGQIKPSGQAGISNLGNVDLFTDALNGDFSINPTLNLSGVGVDPAILAELNARTEAFGVEIGWDRWEVDHLKLTQTILDNIPGVNDGVVGNEIAFTDQGTFNSARTTLSFTTVNGSWKTSRGAASTMDFHLNDDYSTWYKSIENNYKQAGGANYSRIRWGDSVFAQNQILASDGLLVSKVHGTGASTQISAAGRSITLGGDLLVDLYDYDPSKGRTFDLITASQLISSFDRVLFKQPATAHSAVVNLVDTDADTFADTLRLTVGSDNLAPTGTVTISGTATEGQTLTAANSLADADGIPSTGSGAIAYQWNADGTPISGATGSTLVLTQAQVGKAITVTATYTDNGGTAESVTSAATSAVVNVDDAATGILTVTGSAQEGDSLTASLNGSSDPDGPITSTTFQWQELSGSTWINLSGATTTALSIPAGQSYVGKDVRVMVTTTDALGGSSIFTSAGLTIANLDTVAPLFSSGGTGVVNENAAVGSVVYTAAATDSDFNPPDLASSITYSLSGTDAAAFTINASSGVVTINASPDFEIKNTYAFIVVATDAAGNASSQAVALTINDLDEIAPTTPVLALSSGVTDGATTAEATQPGGVVTVTAELAATVAVSFSGSSGTVTKTLTGAGSTHVAVVLEANDLTILGNGSISVSAIATDAAGNRSAAGSTSFTLDTIDPTLVITSPIAGDGFLNNAEDESPLTISGTAAGADGQAVAVTVSDAKAIPTAYGLSSSLSSGAWEVTLSPSQLKAFAEGTINVMASVSDAAGNATAAAAAFLYDRTPQTAPLITATNLSGSRATLAITADPGARLNIYVSLNGGTSTLLSGAANNLVPASGRYSFSTPELADGSYSFTVTSLDQAGNESIASAAQVLAIAPPALPTVSFVDTGVSASDGITSNGVLSVANILAGNGWQYSTNGGANWIPGSGATNSFTLLPGSYAIGAVRVRQVDAAGKIGAAYANPTAINVDVSAPTVAVIAAKASLGLVGTGDSATAETIALTFSFSEDPGDTFSAADITVTAGTISPISGSGLTRTGTYTPPLDFVGSATLTVASGRFTDLAGNINVDGGDANNSLSFSLNTLRTSSAPLVSISSNNKRVKIGDSATLTFTFSQPPSDFTAADITASSGTISDLTASGDSKVWTATYTPAASVQEAVSITVPAGSFGVSGNPAAGTNASASSLSLTVDTIAPPSVLSVAFSADTGSSGSDLITNDPNQTVTGTVSGELSSAVGFNDTVRVSIDNGATWRLAEVTGVARTGFSLGNVTLRGPSTILLVVEDEAGNTSSTFSQSYSYDPITFTGELMLSGYGDNGQTGNLDTTIRQASGQDNSFTLTLPNKEAGASEVFQVSTDGGINWSSTSAAQNNLTDGTYRYRGTVADTAGNTATSNVWTVVVDGTPPGVPTLSLADGATGPSDPVTNQELTSGSGVLRVAAEAGATLQLNFTSTATGSTPFIKSVVTGGSTQAVVLTSAEVAQLRGTASATGSYTVTVDAWAVDRAGNVGASTTPVTFIYVPDPVLIVGELMVEVPENGDGNESGPTDSIFRISRTGDTSQAATVTYRLSGTAAAGMDYNLPGGYDSGADTGTATILAGESFVEVRVPTIDNNTTNGLRQLRLTLQPTASYAIHPTSTYDTATLIDNDAPVVPELSVADVSVVEGNSGNTTLTFTLRLSEATSVPVSLNYAFRQGTATLGSDFTADATSGSLTFPATARQLTLSATVIGDTSVEVDESFFLDLSAPSGLTFAGGGASLSAAATIINDDSAAQVDPNQGVTIISGGNFAGSDRNDTLTGDDGVNRIDGLAGNDVITGGLSADLLFSGAGADVFNYLDVAESSLTFGVDTTDADFITGDRISLPTRPTSLWNTGVITAGSLTAAFQQAQADKDLLTAGSQALAPGEAVLFTWGASSRSRRTYLGVADATTGSVNNDFLLLTPQRPATIGSLSVQSYFS